MISLIVGLILFHHGPIDGFQRIGNQVRILSDNPSQCWQHFWHDILASSIVHQQRGRRWCLLLSFFVIQLRRRQENFHAPLHGILSHRQDSQGHIGQFPPNQVGMYIDSGQVSQMQQHAIPIPGKILQQRVLFAATHFDNLPHQIRLVRPPRQWHVLEQLTNEFRQILARRQAAQQIQRSRSNRHVLIGEAGQNERSSAVAAVG
mmetsp:Transcript_10797/g.29827  ORF Transcript_10797/g.29827 Transcript_10797/m.29827 type:complete len:204 (-) Transcript_10797:1123-1734(-)